MSCHDTIKVQQGQLRTLWSVSYLSGSHGCCSGTSAQLDGFSGAHIGVVSKVEGVAKPTELEDVSSLRSLAVIGRGRVSRRVEHAVEHDADLGCSLPNNEIPAHAARQRLTVRAGDQKDTTKKKHR